MGFVRLSCPEPVGTLTWRDNTCLMVGYSPGVFATGQVGVHARTGAKFPLKDAFRIEAALAHHGLDDID